MLLKPELWPLPAIRERLEEQITAGGLSLEPALGYLVAVLAGVLPFVWLWIFALNLGMRRRRAQARRLGEELRLVDELEPERVPIDPKIDSEAADGGDIMLEYSSLLDKPDSERRIRLMARVQALVVAQRFPRDEFLALEIPCGGHPDTLEVGMAKAPAQQP